MANPFRTLSVTDAARSFADVVNRAFYRNETTVLTRNGVTVAHVAPAGPAGIPASELVARWALLSHLTSGEARKFADDVRVARDGLRSPADKWES